jgi:hypothetical protein
MVRRLKRNIIQPSDCYFLPSLEFREGVLKKKLVSLGLHISMFSAYERNFNRLTCFIHTIDLSTESIIKRRTMHTDCRYNKLETL